MADNATAWYDVLGQFKNKFQEFLNTRNALLQQWPVVKDNPQLLAQWQTLKDRSDTIYNTAMSVNNKIQAAAGWLKDTFGVQLNGINPQLGVVPLLIGVAGVAAAVATMTYFITDYLEFNSRVKLFQQTGDKMVLQSPPGFVQSAANLAKNLWPLALIIAGVVIVPRLVGGK